MKNHNEIISLTCQIQKDELKSQNIEFSHNWTIKYWQRRFTTSNWTNFQWKQKETEINLIRQENNEKSQIMKNYKKQFKIFP